MKKYCLLLSISILAIACNNNTTNNSNLPDINPQFDNYKSTFIEHLWKQYPAWASGQGYHNYDSVLVVPNDDARRGELAFANAQLDSLKKYDVKSLSANNKTDYYIIENQLQSIIWNINEFKSFEWNPSEYNVSSTFAEMLNGNYDSLDVRIRNFNLRMLNVPAYYEAAKNNIKNPTIEHTQLAIDQNLGGLSVFENDFKNAINKLHLGAHEQQMIEANAKTAVKAINEYVDWLKKLDNKTPRSFRIGKELYLKKFEYDIQSGYSANQIYDKAIARKAELHEKMFELSDKLWDKYIKNTPKPTNKLAVIKQVIDQISLKHVQADSFQIAIEQQLPVLSAFIEKKDLLYIDPSKPLVVRREPDYMAGVAGASISAPGPYDKNGNTYYNVGSLSGWPKEKAESYLREYNHYILQILNIHEAIPGHYTQLVYSNQSPSLIKSILGNSAMVEGWAVYTERMMLENGYEESPEMWLMYYKWHLRSVCNTILDYSVHTLNMSKENGLNLLINEAFQQQTEAEGKWKRASLTQVQLCCYFTGYSEIYDFREELKKQMSDKFQLKTFHEQFLSYGSAPVKYIKELMLQDMDKCPAYNKADSLKK
jgi:uncharacterized protein (DUF885 family)